jgi:hypothetical protein
MDGRKKFGKLSLRISAMRGEIFLNAICKKKKDNYVKKLRDGKSAKL